MEEEMNDSLRGIIRDIEAAENFSPDFIQKMKPMASKCHKTIDHIMTQLDPYRELIGLELKKGGRGAATAIEWICSTCAEGFDVEGKYYLRDVPQQQLLGNISPFSNEIFRF